MCAAPLNSPVISQWSLTIIIERSITNMTMRYYLVDMLLLLCEGHLFVVVLRYHRLTPINLFKEIIYKKHEQSQRRSLKGL